MRFNSDHFEMEYKDVGNGIPMLLIHGFPLNNTLWEPQIQGLSDVARVIAPDLRGHGRSQAVEAVYSMEMLAADCLSLLDHLKLRQPIVVGGLSMGGYVALAFYRKYPERVAGLVLAATRAGADSQQAKAGRDESAQVALDQGAPAIAERMLPKMMAPQTYAQNPQLVTFVHEMMEATSVPGIRGALLGMKDRTDSTNLLAQIEKPVLVVHGADDQIIPPQEAEAMHAQIPNAHLHVIPNAGHLVNLEQPEMFNSAVRDFLALL